VWGFKEVPDEDFPWINQEDFRGESQCAGEEESVESAGEFAVYWAFVVIICCRPSKSEGLFACQTGVLDEEFCYHFTRKS
jgi:hypothetical protein